MKHLRFVLPLACVLACAAPDTRAQAPELVRDIHLGVLTPGKSGRPREFLRVSATRSVFLADTEDATAIWETDGTRSGTRVLHVRRDRSPTEIASFAGALFFADSDAAHGTELWVWRAGRATRLTDIARGALSATPGGFYVHGGALFYGVSNAESGRRELWRTDGTAAGTRFVADCTYLADVGARSFCTLGSTLYYLVGSVRGPSLWRTDGTTAGTQQIELASKEPFYPNELTVFGQRLFFIGRSRACGAELWTSDGSSSGTRCFVDMVPGPEDSSPSNLGVVAGRLFWVLGRSPVGSELAYSDGTTKGTHILDLAPGSASSFPSVPELLHARLYLTSTDQGYPSGRRNLVSLELGTLQATTLALDVGLLMGEHVSGRGFLDLDAGKLGFFVAGDAGGTLTVYDPATRSVRAAPVPTAHRLDGFSIAWLPRGRDFLACLTLPGLGAELHAIDRSGARSWLVRDLLVSALQTDSSRPRALASAPGDALYFAAEDGVHGVEAWRSDGTAAGTHLLADVRPGSVGSSPEVFHANGDRVYFAADDGVHGRELWTSRGTAATTQLLADLSPGPASSQIEGFVSIGALSFFRAANSLYRTDGTPAGTFRLVPALPESFSCRRENVLCFVSWDGLYESDGSVAGTRRVLAAPAIELRAALGARSRVYYTRSYSASTRGLWVYDGATHRRLSSQNVFGELVEMRGRVFYAVRAASSVELWSYDPASDRSMRLAEHVVPGGPAPRISHMVATRTRVLFVAGQNGNAELYASDGTRAGTGLVAELVQGPEGSTPSMRAVAGELVLLRTQRGNWWVSDGTPSGTRALASGSAWLRSESKGLDVVAATHGAALYFAATGTHHGTELWRLRPTVAATSVGLACSYARRYPRIASSAPQLGKRWSISGEGFDSGRAGLVIAGRTGRPSALGPCAIYLEMASVVPLLVTPGRAAWSWSLALPDAPSLRGLELSLQAVQDARDTPLGVDVSNALELRFDR